MSKEIILYLPTGKITGFEMELAEMLTIKPKLVETTTIQRWLQKADSNNGRVVLYTKSKRTGKSEKIVSCDNHGRLQLENGNTYWPYEKVYNE